MMGDQQTQVVTHIGHADMGLRQIGIGRQIQTGCASLYLGQHQMFDGVIADGVHFRTNVEAGQRQVRLCGDMHDAWKKRDLDKAFELQDRLMPLHKAMFCETSPGPVKYAAELIGQCSAEMRLPMVPIAESSKKAVREAMIHAGLIN